jgi:hypothetical protein
MSSGRFKNIDWDLANENGNIGSWEHVAIAVLMDIRDELRRINRTLGCSNFQGIPTTLRSIRTAMPTKRERRSK